MVHLLAALPLLHYVVSDGWLTFLLYKFLYIYIYIYIYILRPVTEFDSGIGWPSKSGNSILVWVKTMEYYVIPEIFICYAWQYYAYAALGSFSGIVLAMTVHSTVVAIV